MLFCSLRRISPLQRNNAAQVFRPSGSFFARAALSGGGVHRASTILLFPPPQERQLIGCVKPVFAFLHNRKAGGMAPDKRIHSPAGNHGIPPGHTKGRSDSASGGWDVPAHNTDTARKVHPPIPKGSLRAPAVVPQIRPEPSSCLGSHAPYPKPGTPAGRGRLVQKQQRKISPDAVGPH